MKLDKEGAGYLLLELKYTYQVKIPVGLIQQIAKGEFDDIFDDVLKGKGNVLLQKVSDTKHKTENKF